MALTRAEINKRYALRHPERIKEQAKRQMARRKTVIEKSKEIEVLNEALEKTDDSTDS
jgi:hypothetical protein